LRESEAYGLRVGDLFQQGAIRVERSWFKGSVNPTKTNKVRDVGIEREIFERLMAWIETLPDRSNAVWVFPSERIVTPLLPDNVIRRCIRPRLEPLQLGWITFAVLRRSHSTLRDGQVSEEIAPDVKQPQDGPDAIREGRDQQTFQRTGLVLAQREGNRLEGDCRSAGAWPGRPSVGLRRVVARHQTRGGVGLVGRL
jgi:hypothetical protein